MADQDMDLQAAAQRLDVYRRQLELSARNLEFLQAAYEETEWALATLESWGDQDPDDELLVPLGANTYVHAKVDDPARVILGVGHSYSVQRPTGEAVDVLRKRRDDLKEQVDQHLQQSVQLQQEAGQLQAALESGLQRAQASSPQ